MTPQVQPAEDRDDVEDLDDLDEESDLDRPIPIACRWGMPAWCSTGRHRRCYFTTNADEIRTGTYGHHDGHVWVCSCLCHAHQDYPPCPHPDHEASDARPSVSASAGRPVQVNLF